MFFPFSDDIPRRTAPVVNYAIVVINFTVFVLTLRLAPLDRQETELEFGFIPARVMAAYHHQPLDIESTLVLRNRATRQDEAITRSFRILPSPISTAITLFTSIFMHGSWMHLIMNMWFLWIFGDNVEDRLGHVSYFCFYLLGGLLATLCHWAQEPGSTLPVIGASGAVAAVLGAFMVTWPWARIRTVVFVIVFFTIIRLPALVMLGVWFLTQILEAFEDWRLGLDGGVAWWAHIGGFVTGALLMPLVRDPEPPAAPIEPIYEEYHFIEPDEPREPPR